MQMSCQSKLLLKRLDLFIYLFIQWLERNNTFMIYE